MFNIQPGTGIGFRSSKLIALGLGVSTTAIGQLTSGFRQEFFVIGRKNVFFVVGRKNVFVLVN